jgi:hypothetical protein
MAVHWFEMQFLPVYERSESSYDKLQSVTPMSQIRLEADAI